MGQGSIASATKPKAEICHSTKVYIRKSDLIENLRCFSINKSTAARLLEDDSSSLTQNLRIKKELIHLYLVLLVLL